MAVSSLVQHAEAANRNRWYSANIVDLKPAEPPRAIRALHNEHIYMANLLDSMEEQIGLMSHGQEADFRLLLDIVDYLKNFPDRYHHPKEDLLYQRMSLRDDSSVATLQRLMADHRRLEILIGALGDSLNDYHLLPTVQKRDRVREQCFEYIVLLREHIDDEESLILPRAVEVLRDEDWFLIDQRSNPVQELPIDDMLLDNYDALRRRLYLLAERMANTVVLVEYLGFSTMLEMLGGLGAGALSGREAAGEGLRAYREACISWLPWRDNSGGEKYQNPLSCAWRAYLSGIRTRSADRAELAAPLLRVGKAYGALLGGHGKPGSLN